MSRRFRIIEEIYTKGYDMSEGKEYYVQEYKKSWLGYWKWKYWKTWYGECKTIREFKSMDLAEKTIKEYVKIKPGKKIVKELEY